MLKKGKQSVLCSYEAYSSRRALQMLGQKLWNGIRRYPRTGSSPGLFWFPWILDTITGGPLANEYLVIISKNTQETHRSKLFKTKKSLQQHSCLRENSQVPPNLQQDDEIIEEEIRNLKERATRLVIKKRIHKVLQQWKKTRIVRLDSSSFFSLKFFCDGTLFCYRNRFDRINFILKKPS